MSHITSVQGVCAPTARRPEPLDARYNYAHGQHELILLGRDISEAQARDLRQGTAEFALIVEDPLIVIGARFGTAIPWSFAPFCWHLVPREARVLPPMSGSSDEGRIQLEVLLADGDDGRVQATTCRTLWLDFSRTLYEAIREQARLPFAPHQVRHALDEVLHRSAVAGVLVSGALARCTIDA